MVGERIRILREKAGLSKRQLAIELGIPPSSYTHIETSESISSDKLVKIAKTLNVSIESLLGLSVEKETGKVLSFVNQKGGVGKTTLTILFATMYASLNPSAKVCIIDTDFQQSVSRRAQVERNEGMTPLVDVHAFLAKDSTSPVLDFIHLVEECQKSYDLIVIDTIGSFTDIEFISTIMYFSDVCIIPIQPSNLSLDSTTSTITLLNRVRRKRADKGLNFTTKALITIAKNTLETKVLKQLSNLEDVKILPHLMKDKAVYVRDVFLSSPIEEENFKDVYNQINDLL